MGVGKFAGLVFLATLFTSCAFEAQPNGPVPSSGVMNPSAVQPTMLPPGPSPSSLVCTANPPDLSLEIILGSKTLRRSELYQDVRVQGSGFLPGERLSLVLEDQGTSHGNRMEVFNHPVDDDGHFNYDNSLPLDDPSMLWQVFVVHNRGVACARFMTVQ